MRSCLIFLLLFLSCIPSYSIDTLWIGQAHASPIVALEYSPSGRYIYSAGADSLIKVWDALTGDSVKAYKMPYDISSIFISKNETYMAVGMLKDSTYPRKTSFPAYVIDLRTDSIITQVFAEEKYTFPGNYCFINYGIDNNIAISPNDSLLLTGINLDIGCDRPMSFDEGRVDVWDMHTGEYKYNIVEQEGVMSLGFSIDWDSFFFLTYSMSYAHQAYVSYYSETNNIYLLDKKLEISASLFSLSTSGEIDENYPGSEDPYEFMNYYSKTTISPDATYVAASSIDNKIALFSIPEGNEIKKWEAGYSHDGYSPTDIEVSLNNKYILTISKNRNQLNRLNIWDIKTASIADSMDFAVGQKNKHIAISSDSVHFALAGEDGKIRVFGVDILSSVESAGTAISDIKLYPNPSRGNATIEYSIINPGHYKLIILDFLGREVQTLADEWKEPGTYKAAVSGNGLPSGIYYYELISGLAVRTGKMVIVR